MFFLKIINGLDSDFNELLSHAKNYVSADILAKGLAFKYPHSNKVINYRRLWCFRFLLPYHQYLL